LSRTRKGRLSHNVEDSVDNVAAPPVGQPALSLAALADSPPTERRRALIHSVFSGFPDAT
jgi:hypothetical protein